MPFCQTALGDRLEYELTFNDYSRVIQATGAAWTAADASYGIENISLEFDMVTQPDLARMIASQYRGRLAILYDCVLRYRKFSKDKTDTLWNFNLNVSARSMKGILILFEDAQQHFACNTEAFYNPQILKVEVTIEGVPNQLHSQGMRAYQIWDEPIKFFAPGSKRHPDVAMAAKDLALADVSLGKFLTSKYSLWFDLRTTDDDRLHDNSRRIDEGVTIQITKQQRRPALWTSISFLSWTLSSTLKMAGLTKRPINQRLINQRLLDLRTAHSAIICGQTGCFYSGSARRPLPGVLSTHRGPVPHHTT